MLRQRDILERAIVKRLSGYRRDAVLHAILGVFSIAIGAALFAFLWINYRIDDSELIKQLVGGSTTLVTFGAGGILLNRLLSLRENIRKGTEWLELYQEAIGPPPHNMLGRVKDKILSWLEG